MNYQLKQICKHSHEGSFETRVGRERQLTAIANQLHELGFRGLKVTSLKQKHVQALVDHWLGNNLSPGTIKNRMSCLRWWAEKVNRRAVVAGSNKFYGIPDRQFVSDTSKAKDLAEEQLGQVRDEYIRMSLLLQKAFGLRREEALKIQPRWADRGDHLHLKASWTKGGRERTVPIRTQEQGALLEQAKQLAGLGALIPGSRNYIEQLRIYERHTANAGLSKMHGLRHAYAQQRYAQQKPLQPDRSWKEAVLRYVGELDNPSRLASSRDHLRQLDPFLCELTLNEISMESLQPFIRHRKDVEGVTNATVNRALEIVRRILHLARDEWGWLERFPRIRMFSEPRRRVRFLSRQEADALLEALSAHLRPVVSFGLATGCRMGEILNLEWHRVDFDRRRAKKRHPLPNFHDNAQQCRTDVGKVSERQPTYTGR